MFDKDEKGNPRLFTWDDVPRNIKIVQIALTYPFRVQLRDNPNRPPKDFAPTLTIGKYEKYYFSNEATVRMLVKGEKVLQTGQSELEAKIVGGIDEKRDLVIEVRLDKSGNSTITRFPFTALKERIKAGIFRGDILRDGIGSL